MCEIPRATRIACTLLNTPCDSLDISVAITRFERNVSGGSGVPAGIQIWVMAWWLGKDTAKKVVAECQSSRRIAPTPAPAPAAASVRGLARSSSDVLVGGALRLQAR